MSVVTQSINTGVTTTNSGSVTFLTTVLWEIDVIEIAVKTTLTAEQLRNGGVSYVTLQISNGTSTVTLREDITDTDRQYVRFSVNVSVPVNGTLALTGGGQNITIYGAAPINTPCFCGGYLTSQYAFDMRITIDYETVFKVTYGEGINDGYPVFKTYNSANFDEFTKDENGYPTNPYAFKIDDQNDGYPVFKTYNSANFDEFTKDENGYPTNPYAFKIDDQNDGYAWVCGFEPYSGGGGSVLIIGSNALESAAVFIIGNNELIPASIPIIFD